MMFERLNYTKKDGNGLVDWSLELKEDWIPYSTLLAHFKKEEKVLVLMCISSSIVIKGKCNLCQFPFDFQSVYQQMYNHHLQAAISTILYLHATNDLRW